MAAQEIQPVTEAVRGLDQARSGHTFATQGASRARRRAARAGARAAISARGIRSDLRA